MEYTSPSLRIKRLDSDIRQILRAYDMSRMSAKMRGMVADLQQNIVDARIYTQAYELSETREEQLDNAKSAHHWLAKSKRCILSLSEQDIFGPVDVASMSAQIEQVIDQLN